MDKNRKNYKFKLSGNQKFRKYGEITYTDETRTIRGSSKNLLLPLMFLGKAIAKSLLAGALLMLTPASKMAIRDLKESKVT